jgi:two-component system nitrogen regulation sensor histidine kinase NtrY
MNETVSRQETTVAPVIGKRRILGWFGPLTVTVAVLLAVATLLIFADFTPISPTSGVVASLFIANFGVILLLLGLTIAEVWLLLRARRRQAAGARLHIRIMALFTVIAAAPTLLIAVVGSVTLDRSLNPAFMQDVRGFVYNTAEAARLFRESQCRSLLQEARLTAFDIASARGILETNRPVFADFFTNRTKFLGFSVAALIKPDGTVEMRADLPPPEAPPQGATQPNEAAPKVDQPVLATPEPSDFEDARKNEPLCLILGEGRTFVALREVPGFDNLFLYASRPIDPFAIQFPAQAAGLIQLYEAYDAHRSNIQVAFATMYVLIALIMLLSAIWLGLSFAGRLVTPIRTLIAATDQVATGNLYVQVPVHRSDGDLSHLGETFNKMTSELRLQQNRLIAASTLMDERRAFTEAVLAGVPAAVIGIDAGSRITVVNPAAQKLFGGSDPAGGLVGQAIDDLVPELSPILTEARAGRVRVLHGQITMSRNGRDRMFNVSAAGGSSGREGQGLVVTLDDITELVSAQRTSAWADVARRIAHEIKNPLTPIQLSAERLKRKYGRIITQDREIFDQCTDTIVRQVDDIKRMVDEFSSFARMPKARLEEDDLSAVVRQVLFLMRTGHPDVTMEEHLPEAPVIARFDRRLLSQALTNIVKNATEGIAAASGERGEAPRIDVSLSTDDNGIVTVDVVDNGKGFPKEGRQSLLEPYVTTRAEGTGLGLPIVAKILEDHGGGIELLDAPSGHGAHVRLWFTLRPADHSSDAPASEARLAQNKA